MIKNVVIYNYYTSDTVIILTFYYNIKVTFIINMNIKLISI